MKVTGIESLSSEESAEIKNAAIIPPRTNLIIGRLYKTLMTMELIPSVAKVEVYRRFPNEVRFQIIPRKSVAKLAAGGAIWEVDNSGIIVRRARLDYKLPLITVSGSVDLKPGYMLSDAAVATGIKVVTMSGKNGPIRADSADIDQNGELCLNMRDNIMIRFGAAEDIETKLTLVRRIFEQRPDIGTEVATLDVSVPDHPTCVPRSPKNRVVAEAFMATHL